MIVALSRRQEGEQYLSPAESQARVRYSKEEAHKLTNEAFAGGDSSKGNVHYDLKRDPARYVESTMKMCSVMRDSCDV